MSLVPVGDEWSSIKEQAVLSVKSGLLPREVNTPEKAIVIALKARELGIPMLQGFSLIHVINGKPAIAAELMLALIYKNCPGAIINFTELTNSICTIEAKRPGGALTKFEFTIDDARRAGLLSNQTWNKYPRAMLRSRCVSEMARSLFPDAIMGCSYTPEELGANVDEDGSVIELEPIKQENKEYVRHPSDKGIETISEPEKAAPREIPNLAPQSKTEDKKEAAKETAKERVMNGPALPSRINELKAVARKCKVSNDEVSMAIEAITSKKKSVDCSDEELSRVISHIKTTYSNRYM